MKIIELPREALQSNPVFIPPGERALYLNAVMKVGFNTVEIGSIASPRVMPQMQGTMEVLELLDTDSVSNVMVLVLNKKGADLITPHEKVTHISFPFSVSPSFLGKNTKSTVDETLSTTAYIVDLCWKYNKKPIIYFSLVFGNPYGEEWGLEQVIHWVEILQQMGVTTIPLSNLAISVDETLISKYFSTLIPAFPEIEFGLHLHTTAANTQAKIHAAYSMGCRRFDGVINGLGGCPFAHEEMLGNLKTQDLVQYSLDHNIPTDLDHKALQEVYKLTTLHFHNPRQKL